MTDWWEQIEQALIEGSEDAPDPWADLATAGEAADLGLSQDQAAFLRQLAEQPSLGRFHDDLNDALGVDGSAEQP
ncbi:MAG: hypothetical protein R2694_05575 [Ilumatobacteraceae bacterium]|nr:hypothetical protein [Ilumatobacter sp.]MCO5330810.1 hypothetical protein [Ilumatobacteraceae bacterium]